jgi:carbon-monoxide dehydrogenase medium subunit
VKPAPFVYHAPESRDEVDALLGDAGEEAKILAGGQSLIPILNMRLSAPAQLIDINALASEPDEPELDGEQIRFGPLVRQAAAERSDLVAERLPLLREALRYVAHPAIRTRGTVVGSIAHADPAGELPALFRLLEGQAHVRGARGRRTVPAADLFAGPLENSLSADEWVEEVRLPVAPPERGAAMEEFARRQGDYAICGVLATANPSDSGTRIALSYIGMGEVPVRLELPELEREELAGEALDEAVHTVAREHLQAADDIHASAEYRMHLAERLGVRAARRAAEAIGAAR